jgi:hypothetical protein
VAGFACFVVDQFMQAWARRHCVHQQDKTCQQRGQNRVTMLLEMTLYQLQSVRKIARTMPDASGLVGFLSANALLSETNCSSIKYGSLPTPPCHERSGQVSDHAWLNLAWTALSCAGQGIALTSRPSILWHCSTTIISNSKPVICFPKLAGA